MKTKIFTSVILQFLFISILNAQVKQEWISRYNGPGNVNTVGSMTVDGLGNVYVTGSSRSGETSGTEDYATMRYNSSGVQQWVSRYNGPGNGSDQATAITVDGSGNVYVLGNSAGNGTDIDFATIKYNTAGEQQWVQRYNGPGNDEDKSSRTIVVDRSGNVYVTGSSRAGDTSGTEDFATIKYNSAGLLQWVSRYNGPGNGEESKPSLALDGSGNVYVTGASYGGETEADYATIKYNSLGAEQWVQRYTGPGGYNGPGSSYSSDKSRSIAIDDSGNVYVTGFSMGSGTDFDCATIKYNTVGVQQWVQRFDGPEDWGDSANPIAIDSLGNVFVTGSDHGIVNRNYITLKYSSLGIQQWISIYNGSGNGDDIPFSLTTDGVGNVYVTGYSYGNGTNSDIATIKYDSAGVQQWVQRYNGPSDSTDYGYAIVVDGSGYVYVCGLSIGSTRTFDFVTIKYSQTPTGIYQTTSDIPEDYSLSQNYPNPFNPSTNISFSLPIRSFVSLKIFDLIGREVATIISEEMSAGSHSRTWNAANMSSGIYFYRLQAGVFTETKKLVLLR